jgi:hypothetical protein
MQTWADIWDEIKAIAVKAMTKDSGIVWSTLIDRAFEGIPEFKGSKKTSTGDVNPEYLAHWKKHSSFLNRKYYLAYLYLQHLRMEKEKIPELLDSLKRAIAKNEKAIDQIIEAQHECWEKYREDWGDDKDKA